MPVATKQNLLSPPCTVLAQVHEKLGSKLVGLEPALQVDVVWALCVLQQVREAELQAVLHPEFHAQFLGEPRGASLPLLSDGKPAARAPSPTSHRCSPHPLPGYTAYRSRGGQSWLALSFPAGVVGRFPLGPSEVGSRASL